MCMYLVKSLTKSNDLKMKQNVFEGDEFIVGVGVSSVTTGILGTWARIGLDVQPHHLPAISIGDSDVHIISPSG